jgi:DNA processing protein
MTQNVNCIQLIRRSDAAYPAKFAPYPNMPSQFYLIGKLPEETEKVVGIVGSRSCTPYGRSEAQRFAAAFARAGVSVVSGMASGIDYASHLGAIEAGGRTYAVLGCGVDICYPQSSRKVYDAIVSGAGGVLSEFPPGASPLAWHFPVRNRIISALADVMLIIEAKQKSGSLITAGYALEQGKTIFALPGRTSDRLSMGCNQLIEDGAFIALEPEQILVELGMQKVKHGRTKKSGDSIPSDLDPEEKAVFQALEPTGCTAEQLAAGCGLSPQQVLGALLRLSLRGLANEEVPGWYSRPAR